MTVAANIPKLIQQSLPVFRVRNPADTDMYATATGGAATVTLAATTPPACHKVEGLVLSYSGTPSAGGVTVTDSVIGVCFSVDVTAAGPYILPLGWMGFSPGGSVVIALASGGSGIVGKLNVVGHEIEAS
jgi:hypothetical protein